MYKSFIQIDSHLICDELFHSRIIIANTVIVQVKKKSTNQQRCENDCDLIGQCLKNLEIYAYVTKNKMPPESSCVLMFC